MSDNYNKWPADLKTEFFDLKKKVEDLAEKYYHLLDLLEEKCVFDLDERLSGLEDKHEREDCDSRLDTVENDIGDLDNIVKSLEKEVELIQGDS
jgi:archaellum component FlaC